jgi:hypothetical protein
VKMEGGMECEVGGLGLGVEGRREERIWMCANCW